MSESPLLEQEKRASWGRSGEVPAWALDERALAHSPTSQESLQQYAGPAVHLAWQTLGWTFMLWLATPIATFLLVFGKQEGTGFPTPPPWWLPVLSLGVVKLLLLEHRVRSIVLLPITRRLAGEKGLAVPWKSDPKFETWFIYNLLVSAAAHVDVITNGVFMARAVVSDLWPESRFSELWRALMERSVVSALRAVPFAAFALVGWVSVLAQLANTVLQTFPVTGEDLVGNKIRYAYGEVCPYRTPLQACCWHDYALPHLLDCTRMVSLANPWYQAYTEERRSTAWTRSGIPAAWGSLLRERLTKLLFYGLLESAYQLNLQVAALGVTKAASRTHAVDGITMLSISTSFFMGLYNLKHEYQKASQLAAGIAEIDVDAEMKATDRDWEGCVDACRAGTAIDDLTRQEASWTQRGSREELLETIADVTDTLQKQRTVKRIFRTFRAVSLLYVALLTRALIQTCFVLFCPTGLHNFGVGCVDLP